MLDRKKLLRFAIVFAMGILTGFFIGKASNTHEAVENFATVVQTNTQMTEHFAILLNVFQSNLENFQNKIADSFGREAQKTNQAVKHFVILLNAFQGSLQLFQKEVAGSFTNEVRNSTEAVKKVVVLIDEFKNHFQHLEKEIARKMGIALSANPDWQVPTTDEVLVQAETFLRQGNLAKGGLYFSYSLSQYPGSWEKIQRYQQSVLNYCRRLREKGDYETALNVLTEMEAFLRSQTLYLTIPNLEKLEQVLTEVVELRQVIMNAIAAKNISDTRQFLTVLLVDEWGTPPTHQPQQIIQYIDELQDNLTTLQSLDTSILTETESSKVAQKITQLENNITTSTKNLAVAQSVVTLSTLVQRTELFIEKAKQEPIQSELTLYYLTSAESIIRQLVLLAPETEIAVVPQVAKLSQKLEQAKQEIAQHQSQVIFNEIKQAFNKLDFAPEMKAQIAIDKLTAFKQEQSQQASRLSYLEFLKEVQTMMEKANEEIANWQEKQQRRYEKWAVKQIVQFYKSHKGELGVGTDEKKIFSGIIKHLGNIDTRYLSTSASTAYHEAFNMFYAELSNHLKIPLSSKMTSTEKKPLSDF